MRQLFKPCLSTACGQKSSGMRIWQRCGSTAAAAARANRTVSDCWQRREDVVGRRGIAQICPCCQGTRRRM